MGERKKDLAVEGLRPKLRGNRERLGDDGIDVYVDPDGLALGTGDDPGPYARILFGSVQPAETGIDWRLVKQTVEWKAAGRYDDVLEVSIRTVKVGTSSFTLAFEFRRHGSDVVLVTAETIYVRVDVAANASRPLDPSHRTALERGAPGIVVDHAGVSRLP